MSNWLSINTYELCGTFKINPAENPQVPQQENKRFKQKVKQGNKSCSTVSLVLKMWSLSIETMQKPFLHPGVDTSSTRMYITSPSGWRRYPHPGGEKLVVVISLH